MKPETRLALRFDIEDAPSCVVASCHAAPHKQNLCLVHYRRHVALGGINKQHSRKIRSAVFVYAVAVNSFVKFGIARSVHKRLASIQTGCPYEVRLLGFSTGSRSVEATIHQYLATERIRGEWFNLTERTQSVVDLIVAKDSAALLDLIGFRAAA